METPGPDKKSWVVHRQPLEADSTGGGQLQITVAAAVRIHNGKSRGGFCSYELNRNRILKRKSWRGNWKIKITTTTDKIIQIKMSCQPQAEREFVDHAGCLLSYCLFQYSLCVDVECYDLQSFEQDGFGRPLSFRQLGRRKQSQSCHLREASFLPGLRNSLKLKVQVNICLHPALWVVEGWWNLNIILHSGYHKLLLQQLVHGTGYHAV